MTLSDATPRTKAPGLGVRTNSRSTTRPLVKPQLRPLVPVQSERWLRYEDTSHWKNWEPQPASRLVPSAGVCPGKRPLPSPAH